MISLVNLNDRRANQTLGEKHILVSLSRLSPQYRTKQLQMEKNVIAAYRLANPNGYIQRSVYQPMLFPMYYPVQ